MTKTARRRCRTNETDVPRNGARGKVRKDGCIQKTLVTVKGGQQGANTEGGGKLKKMVGVVGGVVFLTHLVARERKVSQHY